MIIDPKEPIRCLREFLEEWLGTLPPEYGIPIEDIPGYVPRPLRELYSFAGQCPHQSEDDDRSSQAGRQPQIFQVQDYLYGIDDLEQKGERLAFLRENQDGWTCETLISQDDPPVYSDIDYLSDITAKEPKEVCPRLSHFLTTFCLQELVLGSKYLIDSEYEPPESLVKEPIRPVWLNGVYAYKKPTHSFYICQQKLLIMDVCGTIYLAYNDASAISLIVNNEQIRGFL